MAAAQYPMPISSPCGGDAHETSRLYAGSSVERRIVGKSAAAVATSRSATYAHDERKAARGRPFPRDRRTSTPAASAPTGAGQTHGRRTTGSKNPGT